MTQIRSFFPFIPTTHHRHLALPPEMQSIEDTDDMLQPGDNPWGWDASLGVTYQPLFGNVAAELTRTEVSEVGTWKVLRVYFPRRSACKSVAEQPGNYTSSFINGNRKPGLLSEPCNLQANSSEASAWVLALYDLDFPPLLKPCLKYPTQCLDWLVLEEFIIQHQASSMNHQSSIINNQ